MGPRARAAAEERVKKLQGKAHRRRQYASTARRMQRSPGVFSPARN